MFGKRAFQSWLHILVGGLWFAGLFILVILLADSLFGGSFRLSRRTLIFGAGAFVGYLGVSWIVRTNADGSD